MPNPNEDLKARLIKLLEGDFTSDDILSTLNEMTDKDPSKVMDNAPTGRTAAAGEDQSLMTEAQAKADSAYTAVGKRAPEPFSGEKALDYRKRMLIGMQKLAKDYSDVNIRTVSDSATLSVLEDAIYGSARKSVEWAMDNTPGYLHKTVRMDEAGRRITEYQGDPNVWLSAFKTPPRKLAHINTGL